LYYRKVRRRSREVRSGLLITALMERMQLVESESEKVINVTHHPSYVILY
jgi:hypothetical protein